MKIALLLCVAFFVVVVSSSEEPPAETEVKICEPKSVYKKECNTCRCSDDGTKEACTRKGCVKAPTQDSTDGRRKREAENCVPGAEFKRDCNSCKCSADGKRAVCTLKKCPPSGKN